MIRGSAVTNDGAAKIGYTAPAVRGQAKAVREAQAMAGVTLREVSYVELHGTGTAIGDAIEVAALDQAMPPSRDPGERCAIGALKSNVGHLDVTAGVAGLIKTVLALEHGLIPSTVHFQRPHPDLRLCSTRFEMSGEARPWVRGDEPRIAGVSSFGLGGTNAHVVVEEAPERPSTAGAEPSPVVLAMSAGHEASLAHLGGRLAAMIERTPDVPLAGVARSLALGRRPRRWRRAVTARDAVEALQGLRGPAPAVAALDHPRVAMLFPGGGQQHRAMTRELRADPTFERTYRQVGEAFEVHGLRVVEGGAGADPALLRRPAQALPALFALEVALVQVWRSWGVEPGAMLGHSQGEYVAAHVSGVLSLEDAVAMVALRARLFEDLPPGRMIAVPADPGTASELADRFDLSVAATNSPLASVLSGEAERVERLRRWCEGEGLDARLVEIDVAAHSHMLDDAAAELTAFAATLEFGRPAIPYVSNVTANWVSEHDLADPGYWGRHLRRTVRFAEGVATLAEAARVLLELGPGSVLGRHAQACPGGDSFRPVRVVPRAEDGEAAAGVLQRAAAAAWEHGVEVHWEVVLGAPHLGRVHCPAGGFRGDRHVVDDAGERMVPSGDGSVLPGGRQHLVHELTWVRGSLPGHRSGAAPGTWVVFDDGGPGCAQVVTAIEARGGHVHRVTAAAASEPWADRLWPGDEDAVRALLDRALAAPDVQGILYCWTGLDSDEPVGDRDVSAPFLTPLHIARYLAGLPADARRIGFVVAAPELHAVLGTEKVVPWRSLALGPALVSSRECQQVWARVLDLPLDLDAAVADLVVDELCRTHGDDVVALRGRHRWVRSWQRLLWETVAGSEGPEGTCLLTGGLGGIGLAVAGDLVSRGGRAVALLGRSDLPPREQWDAAVSAGVDGGPAHAIAALRAMEAQGARVLPLAADVTDLEALERAVEETVRRLGPVTDLVHAAGLPGGGLIQLRSDADALAVLAPEVHGTLNLSSASTCRSTTCSAP